MDHYIDNSKSMKDIYSIPWKMYLDHNKKCDHTKSRGLKVLILCNPCMGFGDIVFGMKFYNYLKEWYNCDIKIATTNPDGFKSLGMDISDIYLLKSKSKVSQCRKVRRMNFYSIKTKRKIETPQSDLIFIAPLTADFDVDYNDVKSLIPYSNKLNTFFLSEYNDSSRKHIDFQTGIGGKRYGLFLTDVDSDNKKLGVTDNPYSVIYIADSIPRSTSCYSSFIELLVKKYHESHTEFDIVVPQWIASSILKNKNLVKIITKYYDNIEVVLPKNKETVNFNSPNTLYVRGDIFPLQNKDMLQLIKFSVRDILLTGDQSITDALSCCSNTKNIFYQIAPWKENLGKNLSKLLPNKYLKKKTTSCGTINAIKYNSKYEGFNQSWDFRILARAKMDAIFLAAQKRKKKDDVGERTRKFEDIILSSKTLNSFYKKYDEL